MRSTDAFLTLRPYSLGDASGAHRGYRSETRPPMTASPRHVLQHHLRTLDADSGADLVADLWQARGFDVDRDGDTLVATRDGESVVIRVVDGIRLGALLSPAREVNVVVVPAGGRYARLVAARHGARLVDASDLYELFRYALDRPTAAALCESHFGAPLDDLRLPFRLRTYDRLRSGALPLDTVAVGAIVLCCLLVGALVWGLVVRPSGAAGDALGAATGDSPDTGPEVTTTSAGTEPRRATGGTLPPGLAADGNASLDVLDTAHARALRNRSYTLRLRFYQKNLSRPNATPTRVETDVLVDGEQYLVETRLVDDGKPRPITSIYYDGETLYSRQIDALPLDQLVSPQYTSETPDEIGHSLIRRYLSTSWTYAIKVSRGTMYRVVGREASSATLGKGTEVQDYTVVALVTDEGLVRDGRADYFIRSGSGLYDVRFEWRYARMNDTDVDPPEWYVDARAGIASG